MHKAYIYHEFLILLIFLGRKNYVRIISAHN